MVDQDPLARVRNALLAADRLVRAVVDRAHRVRIVVRSVRLRGGRRRIQVTTSDGRRSETRNLTRDAFARDVDSCLADGWRSIVVETTTSTITVRVAKSGVLTFDESPAVRDRDLSHDRAVPRRAPPNAPYLRELGVAGPDGRIHADRQAKYRQIDTFLRILETTAPLSELPRPIRITDLGCGNADLAFAAYDHLSRTLGIPTHITGVDVRDDAVPRNAAIAERLGWPDVRFVHRRILDYRPDEPPHIVLALHACDTATDEALARAIEWRSRVVLAAPCCHHDLQAQLRRAEAPDGHTQLVRHAILRERMGDILTDAMRASILSMHGYRTDVIQFVSSEHTARNLMIRAVGTGHPATPRDVAEYRALCDAWHVTPKLELLVAKEAGPVA